MEFDVKEKELAVIQHLFTIQRYDEAEIHIKNILNQNPFDSEGLYFMAVVYLSREEYDQARKTCQAALQYGFDEVTCYHFIGTVYRYEKNYKSSEQAYLMALEVEPENGELLASYGYLMFITGYEEKALALLENARQLDPHSEQVNQYILEYYFAKADSEEQLHFIKNAMESASDDVQVLINLAVYHALRNEEKEAREYYRQAFIMNPTNQDLLELLADYDERTHILFSPHRLMRKIGGTAVVWIVFMLCFLLLNFTKQYILLFSFLFFYLLFVVYTWVAPLLYKWFVKGRL